MRAGGCRLAARPHRRRACARVIQPSTPPPAAGPSPTPPVAAVLTSARLAGATQPEAPITLARMPPRKLLAGAMTIAALALPAAALAQSAGDQQYQDPLGGQGGSGSS